MADLAVGRINGVVKEADLTAVQIDDLSSERLRHLPWELITDALSKVADDIAGRGLGNIPVVLIALTTPRGKDGSEYQAAFHNAFISIMQHLDRLGVSLVAAVPNDQQMRLASVHIGRSKACATHVRPDHGWGRLDQRRRLRIP